MKKNRQRSNWIVDALLFTGFIVSFMMDLTGLSMHQWIGGVGGLLVVYHLILHWDWVVAVTGRFFGKTSGQARIYYLLDALILVGFYLIVVTGLFMSTWLDLPLSNYSSWKDFHEVISLVTLGMIVIKIGAHWRWIVRVAGQLFQKRIQSPALPAGTAAVPASKTMTRREFLKLMGIVSAASLVAVAFTANGKHGELASLLVESTASGSDSSASGNTATNNPAIAAATPTAALDTIVSFPAATAQATTSYSSYTSQTTANCYVRCDRHCSFPGHCHRYQDSNGNNLCDMGECM